MGVFRMLDPGRNGYAFDQSDDFIFQSISRSRLSGPATATHFDLRDPSPGTPDRWAFEGAFSIFDDAGLPKAGFVTGFSDTDPDGVESTVEGVHFDVRWLFQLTSAANAGDFWSEVFSGDDWVFGGAGAEFISGYAGNDVIFAGAGDNSVWGGDGDDWLQADSGRSQFNGNNGADWLIGGTDEDTLYGNAGNDALGGRFGDDRLDGGEGDDWLWGEEGADKLQGASGADVLYGGAGADVLRGGKNNDWLYGEDGADWLSGDLGVNSLFGGAGADIFNFVGAGAIDWVFDFNAADGDRVHLDPSIPFTLHQEAGNTCIFVGGGMMVLIDVQLSSLPAGWMV